ncbi:probable membrane-associated 30 kDa protein, chloroplastic [Lotus japonicus]|uniref:probable membrane-associated 30 kDa protein, chloroplastic n=1 Tax=Lotus japonicus TaxID=34305 RepID=UPI0025866C50|nr:probable membrane-associated 30 kDa protein, chloroplastic [Lotus japonicus]
MALSMKATPLTGSCFVSNSIRPSTHPPFKSSFLHYGGRALEVPGIRVSYSNRLKCQCHGGGGLGAHMNIFSRFARVIKSYANAIISSFEDPEKILEQAVLDMNNDLVKVRQATAQVLASQKQLESKYTAIQKASDDWYRRAQLALQKGDENLAREALKRRKSYADNATALKMQLEQQRNVANSLVSKTQLLESKIQEAKSKKDTLKARAQSAKTSTIVSEMVSNISTSSALAAFDKMEEKVLTMEAQADALNQLSTDNLEGKFALLENSSVDDDLEELKKEIYGSSKRGELPPGRTVPTNKEFLFPDLEVEKELDELRRRAKGF